MKHNIQPTTLEEFKQASNLKMQEFKAAADAEFLAFRLASEAHANDWEQACEEWFNSTDWEEDFPDVPPFESYLELFQPIVLTLQESGLEFGDDFSRQAMEEFQRQQHQQLQQAKRDAEAMQQMHIDQHNQETNLRFQQDAISVATPTPGMG
ncbi:hypothetical protein [Rhodopirellula bahusiensis]